MDSALLTSAIELYTKDARFCQVDPSSSHLQVIYDLKEKMETCNYLEIGSLFGFSMVHSILSTTPGINIGIDLFADSGLISAGSFNNDYRPDISERKLSKDKTTNLVQQCNVHNHHFEFFQGNSQHTHIYEKVTTKCPKFDLMFIDGDHSYEGVKNDFEKWTPHLKVGGYVLFDDQDYGGIRQLSLELQETNGAFQWIETPEWSPKMPGYFRKLK